jgi:hypothetical protein
MTSTKERRFQLKLMKHLRRIGATALLKKAQLHAISLRK